MNITTITKPDYQELIEIWEDSVRATHKFLPEDIIASLKPMILEHYFDAVNLRGVETNDGQLIGFVGVANSNIEMLFIASSFRGKGAGTLLLQYAITHQNASKVDVNEQNPEALGFYQHHGFKISGRSPLDGQGNPFPLLHLSLN